MACGGWREMPDKISSGRRGRPRYDFRPATMTWLEAAAFAFRRSKSWLRDHRPNDFPAPDPIYGLFATEAVEAWVRRRYGLVNHGGDPDDAERRLLGKLGDGERQGPLPRCPAS